jgi:hypothetical protein
MEPALFREFCDEFTREVNPLEAARAPGTGKASAGPSAARSQDFLYNEDGLPK